jgi:hypothetical protein
VAADSRDPVHLLIFIYPHLSTPNYHHTNKMNPTHHNICTIVIYPQAPHRSFVVPDNEPIHAVTCIMAPMWSNLRRDKRELLRSFRRAKKTDNLPLLNYILQQVLDLNAREREYTLLEAVMREDWVRDS